MKFWAMIVVVFGCGGTVPAARQVARPHEGIQLSCITDTYWDTQSQPLLGEVEHIRHLKFLRPVRVCVQHGAAMRVELGALMDKAHVQAMAWVYRALGVLAPTYRLEVNLLEVLSEQVIGFYDPDRQVLVVRSDVVSAAGRRSPAQHVWQERPTLVHELVHALQDQHFHILELQKKAKTTDAQNALRALIEGDATLAMLLSLFGRLGVSPNRMASQAEAAMQADPVWTNPQNAALMRAPLVVRESLLGSYRDGFAFVLHHYRLGGFPRVNALFKHPTWSTTNVLHPERIAKAGHDAAQRVLDSLPKLEAKVEGRGSTPRPWCWDDQMGESEVQTYLKHFMSVTEASQAASHWIADRLQVVRSTTVSPETGGDETQLVWVWHIAWDTVSAARAIEAMLSTRIPAPRLALHRHQHTVVLKGQIAFGHTAP